MLFTLYNEDAFRARIVQKVNDIGLLAGASSQSYSFAALLILSGVIGI
jgi:hypothetical protein